LVVGRRIGTARRTNLLTRRNEPSDAGGGIMSKVDSETRARIDRWIKENRRNQYGDAPDTMYAGGTPLFDERTGQSRDRYEYILSKHPELRSSR
jgi:hypothetical protein